MDAWATPVTREDAAALETLWASERDESHSSRGGAGVSSLTKHFGSVEGSGVLKLMRYAPEEMVGDNVATPGPGSLLNTSVASVVSFSAAAGDAGKEAGILTVDTFKPGANLEGVRRVLDKGPWWVNLHPENNGGGESQECGTPPSEELQRALQTETAHLLASKEISALRFIVPRGKVPCAFAKGLFTDGAYIGQDSNVLVRSTNVTKALEGPLRPVTGRLMGATPLERILVILTWPDTTKAMFLLELGHYHPSWLTGHLIKGTSFLRTMQSQDFVEQYRLPLWAALAAIPRALILTLGTSAEPLEWESREGAGFREVFQKACGARGGELAHTPSHTTTHT